MTIPRFGRITPVQGRMLQLAGHVLVRGWDGDVTDEQRLAAIEEGHAALVARIGRDLGYELGAWHEQLLSDPNLRGEYRHVYAWRRVFAAVEAALADPNRDRLVAALRTRLRRPPETGPGPRRDRGG